MDTAAAFRSWTNAGFGAELIPVCGTHDACAHPGKRPHLSGWNEMVITPDMVTTWARAHDGNVGLRTQAFPAVDVDDPALADACEHVVLTTLGRTAQRTRANAARRLLLFRREGASFGKVIVPFITPAGTQGKVEILAAGQQCVAAGVHHTGAMIEWRAGQPVAARLGTMTLDGRDTLVAALRRSLGNLGCTVGGSPWEKHRRQQTMAPPGLDGDVAELALRRISPDVEYDRWIRVGMALHARWPGAYGFMLWDRWSQGGEKYRGVRDLAQHWRSFKKAGGVRFGTLIAIARSAGR